MNQDPSYCLGSVKYGFSAVKYTLIFYIRYRFFFRRFKEVILNFGNFEPNVEPLVSRKTKTLKTKTAEFSINTKWFQSNCFEKSQNNIFNLIEKSKKITISFQLLVFSVLPIQRIGHQSRNLSCCGNLWLFAQFFSPDCNSRTLCLTVMSVRRSTAASFFQKRKKVSKS